MALDLEEQEQVDELKALWKNTGPISRKLQLHFLCYMAYFKAGVIIKINNH